MIVFLNARSLNERKSVKNDLSFDVSFYGSRGEKMGHSEVHRNLRKDFVISSRWMIIFMSILLRIYRCRFVCLWISSRVEENWLLLVKYWFNNLCCAIGQSSTQKALFLVRGKRKTTSWIWFIAFDKKINDDSLHKIFFRTMRLLMVGFESDYSVHCGVTWKMLFIELDKSLSMYDVDPNNS